MIRRFCNDESFMRIFFAGSAKEITVMEAIPAANKKKIVFCQKTGEHKFDEKKLEQMFAQCVVGDFNGPFLENMHAVLRSVYLPILSNPKNTQGWPEIALKSFADKYHHTIAGVIVAIGQTKGKTVLALPPSDMLATSSASGKASQDKQDKDRVHVLESAVVLWTERIVTALARDPESVFANDNHPGPLAGVDFWVSKLNDLGDISDQLQGPQIVKVHYTLSNAGSACRLRSNSPCHASAPPYLS